MRSSICLAALLALGGAKARADDLAITSFSGTGQLVFNTLNDGTNYDYRVEWAPSPAGPWRCFDGAAGLLQNISPDNYGSVTCSVPMCCRVVALPPHLRGMVRIPGGTNSGTDPDFGAYSLTVEEFYMDRHEVTKAKWDEVYTWAIANGYSFDTAQGGQGKAADHPVHTLNWYDVVKWCNARSQKEGRPAVYTVGGAVYKTLRSDDVVQTSAAGYRLPTEVEWEYAARGGVANRRFPWGDSDEIQHTRANYWSSSNRSYDTSLTRDYHPTYATWGEELITFTSPVGSFAANGYGLYDMAGNVMEWCFDWYPGLEGYYRVVRGGSWRPHGSDCRVGRRIKYVPYDYFDRYLGFRAVLPPGQQ